MKTYQGSVGSFVVVNTNPRTVSIGSKYGGSTLVPLSDIIGFLGELGYAVVANGDYETSIQEARSYGERRAHDRKTPFRPAPGL